MCGLTLSIRLVPIGAVLPDPVFDSLALACSARGPDSQRTYTHYVQHNGLIGSQVEVKLVASVLGLRGEGVTVQPLVGQRGILGWNGQVFQGMQVGPDENDTQRVFERLEAGEEVDTVLSSIEGPFAFIYLDLITETLHFQLDPLSRRSLLVHPPDLTAVGERFVLSSVRSSQARQAGWEMRNLDGGEGGVIRFRDIQVGARDKLDLSRALVMRSSLGPGPSKWTCIPSINPSLPDSTSAPEPSSKDVSDFISNLAAAVSRRITNIPSPLPEQARAAVLFSGGIDCTVLAFLVHLALPPGEPIDLVNVAFSRKPAEPSKGKERSDEGWNVPDRITGLEAVDELKKVVPERGWKFVEVNVTYAEAIEHRQRVIDLMYPAQTEMDLSLAFPLYFASRGCGSVLTSTGQRTPYQVKARVYISGLGADEQLGGYSRHRRAFTHGWQALIDEISLDTHRLPTRNLSRDDRIISSHARDARYPYLDLAFIDYLAQLPMWIKCRPVQEGGDKQLLRLAATQLGLIRTAARAKRAMQFGTRSSKLSDNDAKTRKGERQVESFD
ncbi:asparagine synthase-domain-containing protein [Naematelia encephala]|uniref:Asparagine synthase-domain-containing protein n=1 Tax=Naematelia encephala TaxID=71784 RepID=A0A1Y2BHI4_9TREE|nr:asparagine synthase-domain-containing protein [Naematelia encephala]